MWPGMMKLAFACNDVIALRLAKLWQGDAAACMEAYRMVAEKVEAAAEANLLMCTGATFPAVVDMYCKRVDANSSRLRPRRRRQRR